MPSWASKPAHRRCVDLTIRTGDRDAEPTLAATWGERMVELAEAAPARTPATVTMFDTPDGVRLTLVGTHPHLSDLAGQWSNGHTPLVQTFGETDVVEFATESSDH